MHGARVALIVALLGLLCGPVWGTAPAATPPTLAAFQPTYNGNFSIAGPGPESTLPAASVLSVQYEIRDANYTPTQVGLYVRVPAPTAQFNVSYGTLRIQLPGATVFLNSTNWTSPAGTTTNQQLLNQTVFPDTGRVQEDRAVLASGDLALTSPAPFGGLTVNLRWRWAATPSFGANFTGAWEPSPAGQAVQPDQYVPLQSASTPSANPGQSVAVCLTGPIAGRTFSVQAVIPGPRLEFANVTSTLPRNASGAYCLTLAVPSWLPPQTIDLFVWDYHLPSTSTGNITSFLLYEVKLSVTPPNDGPPSLYGVADTTWYELLGGIGGLLAVGIGVSEWHRYRRRRPPARSSPPRPTEPPKEWDESSPRTGTRAAGGTAEPTVRQPQSA